MKRFRLLAAVGSLTTVVLLAACGGTPIEGTWTAPIPGMEGRQGFTLSADGSAVSVGMHTLLYDRWKRQGGRLMLHGRSLGNGQTIGFSDTLTIVRLSADSLVLRRSDGLESRYGRE